jgi:hypothetical protein
MWDPRQVGESGKDQGRRERMGYQPKLPAKRSASLFFLNASATQSTKTLVFAGTSLRDAW